MKKSNKKRVYAFAMAALLSTTLAGCSAKELANSSSNLDMLTTKTDTDGSKLNSGVTQRKEVAGEDFNLLINYTSGEGDWHINSNKSLNIDIKTENLPENLAVYIDNVHIDTSIVSSSAIYDGILQDTMDDHTHSSLVLGFPISDTQSYHGVDEIDGQNETFISGMGYGNAYYSSGSIVQKRLLESDYLRKGVYANKVSAVIDLWIVDKPTGEVLRQVSVKSELLVEVNDIVTFEKKGEYITYDFERDGSYKEIKREKVLK